MPLLLCPNDNGAMQTVQRSGVEFDICPTCRGVWLDRGELEKLLSVARDDAGGRSSGDDQPTRSVFTPAPPQQQDSRRDRYDDDDYRGKKKRSSIFDIFD
jgi:uncharacterized protein